MDVFQDLPMGFGMALMQNERAMQYFNAQSPARKQAILNQTNVISSKAEMRAFVDALPNTAL